MQAVGGAGGKKKKRALRTAARVTPGETFGVASHSALSIIAYVCASAVGVKVVEVAHALGKFAAAVAASRIAVVVRGDTNLPTV